MGWLSVVIGIFAGLFLYTGYILIRTLIQRKKAKKQENEIDVKNDVEN